MLYYRFFKKLKKKGQNSICGGLKFIDACVLAHIQGKCVDLPTFLTNSGRTTILGEICQLVMSRVINVLYRAHYPN